MIELCHALLRLYLAYLVICAVWIIGSLHEMKFGQAVASILLLVFVVPVAPIAAVIRFAATLALELAGAAFRFEPPRLPSLFEWAGDRLRGYRIDHGSC